MTKFNAVITNSYIVGYDDTGLTPDDFKTKYQFQDLL